jgi:hypothetical protein
MFRRLLNSWFRPRTIQRKPSRVRLLLEELEGRIVPSAPVGQPDVYSVHHGEVLDSLAANLPTLLDNDSDPDGNPIEVQSYTDLQHGQLDVFPDGNLHYLPDADFAGTYAFTYIITNGTDSSSPINVTINVTDTPVVAVDDS